MRREALVTFSGWPALAISLAGMASQERPVIKLASPGRWAVRADVDDVLRRASLVFGGAAVWGSAVAIRDQLPGRPFGITVPLSVPTGSWPDGGGRGRSVAHAGRGRRGSGGCPAPRIEPAARGCLRDDRRRVHRGNLDRAGHLPARIVVASCSPGDRVQYRRLGRTHRSGPAALCQHPSPERSQSCGYAQVAALGPARRIGPLPAAPSWSRAVWCWLTEGVMIGRTDQEGEGAWLERRFAGRMRSMR